ncbi:MAG: hypothetical protein EOR56_34175, partial [Mesorhizobium sp.]
PPPPLPPPPLPPSPLPPPPLPPSPSPSPPSFKVAVIRAVVTGGHMSICSAERMLVRLAAIQQSAKLASVRGWHCAAASRGR